MAKFEILKSKNGEFMFNLKSSNGQIILWSNNYMTIEDCKHGIEVVKKNGLIMDRYVKKDAPENKLAFDLMDGQENVAGHSMLYESESGRNNAIESVKRNAPIALVFDLSTGMEG